MESGGSLSFSREQKEENTTVWDKTEYQMLLPVNKGSISFRALCSVLWTSGFNRQKAKMLLAEIVL